jgi:CRP/FNR family cyclic AMP-dependent transcriptional regulator
MVTGNRAHGFVDPGTFLQLLRQVSLFADVPTGDLQSVAQSVRTLTLKKGGRVFEEGSVADDCFVLTSGRAKVVLSGRFGADVMLGTVEPFELVGELALLDGSRRSAGLVTMEESRLLRISRQSFSVLRNNRAFEDKLVAHVTTMLRRATEQLRAIYTYSSEDRVAWCLARLAARSGQRNTRGIAISPRPAHQELAEMTGCSRETVSRILGRFEEEKRVVKEATAYVLNERFFRRYLECEPEFVDVDPRRVV